MNAATHRAVVLCARACVVVVALQPAAAVPSAAGSDASGLARAMVRVLAGERAGLAGFHRHFVSAQRAPGHNEDLVTESGRLQYNGRLIAVRLYSQVTNGKIASAADLAKQQSELDKSLPEEDYSLPLTDDQLSEYRVENAACAGCAPGQLAIAFTSLKRDEGHGDGVLIVDASSHHIVRIQFEPSVLPKHVDTAAVTMTFGRVLPDLWDLVEVTQRYDGHMMFIHGGATLTTTFSNYHRFKSRPDGLAALAAGI